MNYFNLGSKLKKIKLNDKYINYLKNENIFIGKMMKLILKMTDNFIWKNTIFNNNIIMNDLVIMIEKS